MQVGDRVSGLVGTADVEGFVAPDGTLSLRGFAPAAPVTTAGSFELKQFEVCLDAERGLTCRLDYAALMSGEYSGYSTGAAGPIVSATRRPLDSTLFNGTWAGYYTTASCTPATSCAYEKDRIELSLQDAGGAVTGTLALWPYRVQLAGQASSSRAELRGQVPWGRNGTAAVVVAAQRTPTGRLTGTVELAVINGPTIVYSLASVVPIGTID